MACSYVQGARAQTMFVLTKKSAFHLTLCPPCVCEGHSACHALHNPWCTVFLYISHGTSSSPAYPMVCRPPLHIPWYAVLLCTSHAAHPMMHHFPAPALMAISSPSRLGPGAGANLCMEGSNCIFACLSRGWQSMQAHKTWRPLTVLLLRTTLLPIVLCAGPGAWVCRLPAARDPAGSAVVGAR